MSTTPEVPLWNVEDGGTATVNEYGDFIWVQPPSWLTVARPGCVMSPHWGMAPANDAAKAYMERFQLC